MVLARAVSGGASVMTARSQQEGMPEMLSWWRSTKRFMMTVSILVAE